MVDEYISCAFNYVNPEVKVKYCRPFIDIQQCDTDAEYIKKTSTVHSWMVPLYFSVSAASPT